VDLVYILGTGGHPDELKYSIRSMQKHLHGLDRIFVVGSRPVGVYVSWIPLDDPDTKNRAKNIYQKILAACSTPDISDQFVCASDDHFLLKDFQAEKLPSYYSGCLSETLGIMSPKNYYRKHVEVTYQALKRMDLPTRDFNVHFPVVYDKRLFPRVTQKYDWTIPNGYISKSLFLNSMRIDGEQIKDCKISTPKTKTAIYRKIKNAPFFSTDTYAMNPEMWQVLEELFPESAKLQGHF
jgi:hypothetical protein